MPDGIDKGRRSPSTWRGAVCRPAQAIAIGDSASDLRMAPHVGRFHLVANGARSAPVRELALAAGNVVIEEATLGDGWASAVRSARSRGRADSLVDRAAALRPALRCVLMGRRGQCGHERTKPSSSRRTAGPLSYLADEHGELTARRGGGGMISALEGHEQPITWVCAALTDGDRAAVRAVPDGRMRVPTPAAEPASRCVRMLELDRVIFDRAYNAVANRTLWFIAHLLFDTASAPTFGRAWAGGLVSLRAVLRQLRRRHWPRTRRPAAKVLIQDYHLVLAPTHAARAAPRAAHLALHAHAVGSARTTSGCCPMTSPARSCAACSAPTGWAFTAGGGPTRFWTAVRRCSARRSPAIEVTFEGRDDDGRRPSRWVSTVPELRSRAEAADVASRMELLAEQIDGRRLLLRIDRTELSKNIVRGLEAYRELLRARIPSCAARSSTWRSPIRAAMTCPSTANTPPAVQRIASDISEEFGRPGWEPVRLEVSDDFPRSLAAYALADVLVVNPVRDGMNLVAKEGPVLSQRDLALVLSREAGAVAELGADALRGQPLRRHPDQRGDVGRAAACRPPSARARCERLARGLGRPASRRSGSASSSTRSEPVLASRLGELAQERHDRRRPVEERSARSRSPVDLGGITDDAEARARPRSRSSRRARRRPGGRRRRHR